MSIMKTKHTIASAIATTGATVLLVTSLAACGAGDGSDAQGSGQGRSQKPSATQETPAKEKADSAAHGHAQGDAAPDDDAGQGGGRTLSKTDREYVHAVRYDLEGSTVQATFNAMSDKELVKLGWAVCDQARDGDSLNRIARALHKETGIDEANGQSVAWTSEAYYCYPVLEAQDE